MKLNKIIKMKSLKYFLSVVIAAGLLSCNQDKIDQLTSENEELKGITSEKEQSINELLASFNEIQSNLNEIKRSEGIIEVNTSGTGEGTEDISESIQKDIELINRLMQKNEELIGELNQKLSDSGIKMEEFRKMISNLNEQISLKNNEIAALNSELKQKKIKIGQLYFSVDSLTYTNRLKDAQLEEKIDKLNEAFYAYGTYKELKEKNVLTKEGGFLGLGKNEELKDNFNKEYFSRIDIRKQKSFLIYANKVELITNHPTGSYELRGEDGKVDSLVITNTDDFWRASKYLVIVVD